MPKKGTKKATTTPPAAPEPSQETATAPEEVVETPEAAEEHTEAPAPALTPEEKKETVAIATAIVEAKTSEEAVAQFTPAQVALIKRLVAKDATDDELHLFVAVCKGAGLNPFLRQVYYVKRWSTEANAMVGAIQVGIDGFRAIAEGTGAYAGNADPVFEGTKEIEYQGKKFTVPEKATVTVRKVVQGTAYDFTATARWDEFYPGDKQGFMWRTKPHVMLGKCAEGQALRKAFPKQLSGLYTPEEMQQAGPVKPALPEDPYAKARQIIERSTNADGLEAMTGAIKSSDKYDAEQKEQLLFAIDERVRELRKGPEEAPQEHPPEEGGAIT